jgi:hypothetical protein
MRIFIAVVHNRWFTPVALAQDTVDTTEPARITVVAEVGFVNVPLVNVLARLASRAIPHLTPHLIAFVI